MFCALGGGLRLFEDGVEEALRRCYGLGDCGKKVGNQAYNFTRVYFPFDSSISEY